MTLRIDHVTIAASRLEAAASAFAAAGLDTEYGGHHSNGATHMSLLGFEDGSYIELVSVVRPGLQAPRWQAHIAHDVGPCAWAAWATADFEFELSLRGARQAIPAIVDNIIPVLDGIPGTVRTAVSRMASSGELAPSDGWYELVSPSLLARHDRQERGLAGRRRAEVSDLDE